MPSQHIVRSFDQDLAHLAQNLNTMANTVRLSFERASKALLTHNVLVAKEIVKQHETLQDLQHESEKSCMTILALRQPVAIDLRNILGAIKISAQLEHIGGDILNICKRIERMESAPDKVLKSSARALSKVGSQSLQKLEALIANHSLEDAQALYDFDDIIDEHYTTLYCDVIQAMKKKKKVVPEAMHLLFAAKNIERIGDSCADIARLIREQITHEDSF